MTQYVPAAATHDRNLKKARNCRPESGIVSIREDNDTPTASQQNGILVITGPNGSGKTLFLESLEAKKINEPPFSDNEITIKENSIFYYYCPSKEAINLKNTAQNYSKTEGYLQEVLDAYSPADLDIEELSSINYILGKDYTSIQFYEIEESSYSYDSADSEATNSTAKTEYFIFAEEGTRRRGADLLSHGELYIIDLIIKARTQKDVSLLIDEPETYLYPKAQERLIEVLAHRIQFDKRQLIIATHSKDIITNLIDQKILTIIKDQAETEKFYFFNAKKHDLEICKLGIMPHRCAIILVEDKKALQFLKEALKSSKKLDKENIHIVVAKNGESSIKLIHDSILMPKDEEVIFCFDADASDELLHNMKNYLILPGTSAPEQELISVLKLKKQELAKRFVSEKIHLSVFERELMSEIHRNHHDFFLELSRSIQTKIHDDAFIRPVTAESLFSESFNIWLTTDKNKLLITEFIDELEKLVTK